MECYDEELHIVIVAWKGKTSVRAYVAKCDRIHFLRLCGGDLSKFGKHYYNPQPSKLFFLHRSSLLETNKFAKERSVENELEENNDENCDDAHDPINLADVKDETDGMNDENN